MPVPFANGIDMEIAIACSPTPVDRGREYLPGLLGAVSGRTRPPETPSLPTPTPLHVLMHQRDQRFDVAIAERFVCLADSFHEIMVDVARSKILRGAPQREFLA